MIQLSLSREALAGMHEGQLINAAWWLWECEELIEAEMPTALQAIEHLVTYGFVEVPYQPGKIIYYKSIDDIPYGVPPGRLY